jgi:hypothetical protein
MTTLPGMIRTKEDGRVTVQLRNGGLISGSFPCNLANGTLVYAAFNYDSMTLVGVHERCIGEHAEMPDDGVRPLEVLEDTEEFLD